MSTNSLKKFKDGLKKTINFYQTGQRSKREWVHLHLLPNCIKSPPWERPSTPLNPIHPSIHPTRIFRIQRFRFDYLCKIGILKQYILLDLSFFTINIKTLNRFAYFFIPGVVYFFMTDKRNPTKEIKINESDRKNNY